MRTICSFSLHLIFSLKKLKKLCIWQSISLLKDIKIASLFLNRGKVTLLFGVLHGLQNCWRSWDCSGSITKKTSCPTRPRIAELFQICQPPVIPLYFRQHWILNPIPNWSFRKLLLSPSFKIYSTSYWLSPQFWIFCLFFPLKKMPYHPLRFMARSPREVELVALQTSWSQLSQTLDW